MPALWHATRGEKDKNSEKDWMYLFVNDCKDVSLCTNKLPWRRLVLLYKISLACYFYACTLGGREGGPHSLFPAQILTKYQCPRAQIPSSQWLPC
jgi:molybdopterin/thiamine biosynthesis adenylyltransferase